MNRLSSRFLARRAPRSRERFRSVIFSRTQRALVAVGLAVVLGLSTPFSLAVMAQNSGEADLQNASLPETTGQKDDAYGDAVSKSDGFIIREDNGEAFCRDATTQETRELNRRDPNLVLRPINHLEERLDELGVERSATTGGGSVGLRIILRATPRLDANPQAKDAFIRAAAQWEAIISSPITVVIDVDYGPDRFGEAYPDGVLGSTGGQSLSFANNYPTVRTKLIANASNAEEAALYNTLPPAAVPSDIGNITRMFVSSPILRALGEISPVADPATETNFGPVPSIGFNSNASAPFDFDPTDGIPSNSVDFESVTIHEIGHVLGFTSDVGDRELEPTFPLSLSMWDLFRVRPGTASPATFPSVARILRSGGEHVHYDGATELRLSTGRPDGTGGDGRQASHWKDDLQNNGQFIGIMDPTLRRGRHETINANDRKAVDLFGYSVGALPPAPANDDFANASNIGGTSGTPAGTNINATKETNEPQHANNAGGRSVWYRWTAPSSGSVTIDTVGSSFDTTLGVYTGASVNALNGIASNDDITNGIDRASRVTFNASAGTTYQIAVDGFNGSFGSITLNWSLVAPPVIALNFSQANYQVSESGNHVVLTVTRPTETFLGLPLLPSAVGYTLTNGTASAGNDYVFASGTVNFETGEASKTFTVNIINDALVEPDETFSVSLINPTNGGVLGSQSTATVTILDDDRPNSLRFSTGAVTMPENANFVDLSVARSGDTAGTASVSYFTIDGSASDRSDFATTHGTLRFAAGETLKTIRVFITDDAHGETSENFTVGLGSATNTVLELPDRIAVTITDDDTQQPKPNPIDDAQFFARQHYVDFLNREPDAEGLAYWTNQIAECGSDAACREIRRINVSAAFFLSIEFQQTGFFAYLTTQAITNRAPDFDYGLLLSDAREVGEGVVVNAPGWQAKLDANKQAFVERSVLNDFYLPQTMSPESFVDRLNSNTGMSLTPTERNGLVAGMRAGQLSRAQVLRAVVENETFRQREKNRAFVMMQYIGYLRRQANMPPNTDFTGYNFWLGKLNQFGGNFVDAEMVKAFINSGEYRERFGAQ